MAKFAEFFFHALGCIRGLSPPLWDTWSLFGVERHYRGKEQAPMSEQAPKVKHKNIPEWAQGLYYNSGLMSEILVYYDEEASTSSTKARRVA
jgi:hypothetical protein